MRSLLCGSRFAPFASACVLASFGISAPAFAASTGTVPAPMNLASGSVGRPSAPGRHGKGDEKLIYARVRDGVYTVDGMVAKIELNYDVQGATFMYLFVPGIGTAVVSLAPEPDAIMTSAALHDAELTFTVDGHHFGLTGVSLASTPGGLPEHLYVHLDRSAWHLSHMPMVGFGNRAELPYEWPGALPPQHAEESNAVPPVPASLLPNVMDRTPAAPAPAPAPGNPAAVSPAALHPVALR